MMIGWMKKTMSKHALVFPISLFINQNCLHTFITLFYLLVASTYLYNFFGFMAIFSVVFVKKLVHFYIRSNYLWNKRRKKFWCKFINRLTNVGKHVVFVEVNATLTLIHEKRKARSSLVYMNDRLCVCVCVSVNTRSIRIEINNKWLKTAKRNV